MKSQVEFYLRLCQELVLRDPLNLTTSKHLRRDLETLQSRTTNEGLSFLTKCLPRLGKALDLGLSSSQFTLPREFKRSHGNGSIPAFLQAYFNCVFDENGCLRDGVPPEAVRHLRQVLFFVYKLEIPYSKEDEQRVVDSFVLTDADLELPSDIDASAVLAAASYVTRDIFAHFDEKDIVPRHGPGAVATGEKLDEKWVFNRLYNKIHQVYPYYNYFVVGGSDELIDRLAWYHSLTRTDEGQARVVLVPKDSRGPRLISCEPLEFQWVQQGLGRALVSHLESNWMTSGQINFRDQSVNGRIALDSSLSLEYSTLDLKDASDRVSLELVRKVFSKTPKLLRALEACRTSATLLPDGRVLPLQKFAPMGSAICFPVEAYIFWVVLVASISRERRMQPSEVGKRIFVYGDDIAVPTDWALECVRHLERFALRVNHSKCCIQGPFRESCGVDAFLGENVTPLKLKTLWTGNRTDGSAYVSYVAAANSLSSRGYQECADSLWSVIEDTYGAVPHGTSWSSFPCRVVDDAEVAECENKKRFKYRQSRRYQRIEFSILTTTSRRVKTGLDGWQRVLRNIVMGASSDPSTIVIPRSMQIKRGWAAVY
jgi:hypothetical protein